jgi:mannose-6-phosphate isomerase-like protein (cupin superfamily)
MNGSGWNIIKQDERYIVKDNNTLKKLITSITELNPFQSTTGHSHAGQEEVYMFRSGTGEMEINEKRFKVKEGDIIFIEDGDFHRVHNTTNIKLDFVCVFDGIRSH